MKRYELTGSGMGPLSSEEEVVLEALKEGPKTLSEIRNILERIHIDTSIEIVGGYNVRTD